MGVEKTDFIPLGLSAGYAAYPYDQYIKGNKHGRLQQLAPAATVSKPATCQTRFDKMNGSSAMMEDSRADVGRFSALIVMASAYEDLRVTHLRPIGQYAGQLAAVLGDPLVGGYRVKTLLNEAGHLVREELDGFFADRRVEDQLVLYLSCHGIRDPSGRLHFAASTTKLSRLASTAISADFVYELVDRCRARRILLLLDCCYSGAYLKGHRPRGESRVGVKPLEGRGRAVITSCTALEYAFEIDTGRVGGGAAPSVFTAALVEGLRTGAADRDGDGLVSVDELYTYLFDRIRETTPHQTPEKKWAETRGDFFIARNPHPPARSSPLSPPDDLDTTAGNRPQHLTSRRALLGLVGASAAGLAITGWELAHSKGPSRPRTSPTPTMPTTLWTFPLEDHGTTLQAMTGGIVYATTHDNLYALQASNGKKLWSSKNGSFTGSGKGVVYIGGGDGLYMLDAQTGRETWHAPLQSPSQPAVTSDLLYTADIYGEVYALRASDGRIAWSFITSQGEPSGVAASKDAVYTAGVNQAASVYALREGKELWRSPISQVYEGPLLTNSIVHVITNLGRWHALRASDGHEIWASPENLQLYHPLISANVIYAAGDDGFVYALNPSNGTRIWRFPGKEIFLLRVTGETVLFVSNNELYALDARHGTKMWNFSAESVIQAISSNPTTVYVGSNNLYALSARSGRSLWSLPEEAAAYSAVAVEGDVVFFASLTGSIYAIHAQNRVL